MSVLTRTKTATPVSLETFPVTPENGRPSPPTCSRVYSFPILTPVVLHRPSSRASRSSSSRCITGEHLPMVSACSVGLIPVPSQQGHSLASRRIRFTARHTRDLLTPSSLAIRLCTPHPIPYLRS